MKEGLVIRSTGSWYEIKCEDEIYQGRLRGVFRKYDLKVTNPIAVGDRVAFEEEKDKGENTVVINDILDRKNYFIRKSTRKTAHAHVLAANIDQAIILVTIKKPRTSRGFIDRFLVTTESFRIPTVIVFNKADLLKEQDWEYLEELISIYAPLGYTCAVTSAISNEGVDDFKSLLDGKISLLAGHSGAGKSTLVNHAVPGLEISTSEISKFSNKGKHTTTFAEMHDIGNNSAIIDSPGIKEIGLWGMTKDEVSHYFPEMRKYLGECQFNDCTHVHEPGCKVLSALEEGLIHPWRYENYLSILEDDDFRFTPKDK